LSSCTTDTADGSDIGGVSVGNTNAYVDGWFGTLAECTTNGDGSLSNCAGTGVAGNTVTNVITANGYAYISTSTGVTTCTIGTGGSLSSCNSFNVAPSHTPYSIALNGSYAYVATIDAGIYVCAVSGATLSSCAPTGGLSSAGGVAIH
jgi:hypothetical protein